MWVGGLWKIREHSRRIWPLQRDEFFALVFSMEGIREILILDLSLAGGNFGRTDSI